MANLLKSFERASKTEFEVEKLRKKLKKFLTSEVECGKIKKLSYESEIAPCKLNNEMLTLNSM